MNSTATQVTKQVTYVSVTNRNNGFTGYTIPDLGVKRNFNLRETKQISLDELKALSYVPGGEYILKNYLIVKDKSALDFLNIETEPEYFYGEEQIKFLLDQGSLDQLDDCLTFAPVGVIELVKDIAVKTELPDMRKRKLIAEKTGFDVNSAINVNAMMNAEDATPAEQQTTTKRKAAPVETASTTSARKSAVPTIEIPPIKLPVYNVTSK